MKYDELSWDYGRSNNSDSDSECLPCIFLQFGAVDNGIPVTKLIQIFSRQAAMMDALISHFTEQLNKRRISDSNGNIQIQLFINYNNSDNNLERLDVSDNVIPPIIPLSSHSTTQQQQQLHHQQQPQLHNQQPQQQSNGTSGIYDILEHDVVGVGGGGGGGVGGGIGGVGGVSDLGNLSPLNYYLCQCSIN